MREIAIIGLGLMGASLAMALRGKGRRVTGWSRDPAVSLKLEREGALDRAFAKTEDILRSADITVICLPVLEIPRFCRAHAAEWKDGALVTDTGSVKGLIARECEEIFAKTKVLFTGSHPMCGSEKAGHESARADLYQNAVVFMTGESREIKRMWEDAGAQTYEVSADEHDRIAALTSHLPHLAAMAMTLTVLGGGKQELCRLAAAGSFRDATRVAASNPALWRQIIEANRDNSVSALNEYIANLEAVKRCLETGDLERFERDFERAGKLLAQIKER